jgi:hypothetical protein
VCPVEGVVRVMRAIERGEEEQKGRKTKEKGTGRMMREGKAKGLCCISCNSCH